MCRFIIRRRSTRPTIYNWHFPHEIYFWNLEVRETETFMDFGTQRIDANFQRRGRHISEHEANFRRVGHWGLSIWRYYSGARSMHGRISSLRQSCLRWFVHNALMQIIHHLYVPRCSDRVHHQALGQARGHNWHGRLDISLSPFLPHVGHRQSRRTTRKIRTGCVDANSVCKQLM